MTVDLFKGYLTYTLAALAVIGAAAGYVLGYIGSDIAITMIWAGLSVFGIRRAISAVQNVQVEQTAQVADVSEKVAENRELLG